MLKAVELFSAVPKLHNCAQSVAAGSGNEALSAELTNSGGGRAPEGRCGALYAALLLTPPENHDAVRAEFKAEAGAEDCRTVKLTCKTPCIRCVELGALLVEKYQAK